MEIMKEKLRKNSSLDTTIDSIDPDQSFSLNDKESLIQPKQLTKRIPALILAVDSIMYLYTLVDY